MSEQQEKNAIERSILVFIYPQAPVSTKVQHFIRRLNSAVDKLDMSIHYIDNYYDFQHAIISKRIDFVVMICQEKLEECCKVFEYLEQFPCVTQIVIPYEILCPVNKNLDIFVEIINSSNSDLTNKEIQTSVTKLIKILHNYIQTKQFLCLIH